MPGIVAFTTSVMVVIVPTYAAGAAVFARLRPFFTQYSIFVHLRSKDDIEAK